MGRRGYPLQPRLGIVHIAFPVFHGYDRELAVLGQHVLAHQHASQLAAGESVDVGNLELAHEGEVAVFDDVAFDLLAPDGVGPVEYDKLDAVFGGGLHGYTHGADVGERAAAYVLNVIDEHVDALEHLGGRRAGLPVERIDRQSGRGVGRVFYFVAGMHVAAHTVFGAVKSHQIDVGSLKQDIDGRFQRVVYPCGVGDETDSFPFQYLEVVFFQNLDSRHCFLCTQSSCKNCNQAQNYILF